jgi:polyisoprenoid-binding protein YceI
VINSIAAVTKRRNNGFIRHMQSAPVKWLLRVLVGLLSAGIGAPALRAQESVITVDPAATQIQFTLGATMHTVHGTFKLKRGQIQFDPATGHVSGSVIIDATSGNTDNTSRDKNMHTQVLESAKFSEIVFTPTRINGAIPKEGTSQVEVSGVIRIHGADHPVTLTFSVQPGAGGLLQASTQFPVPYKTWGLKDPSTFLLHVSDTVNVDIHAIARIVPIVAPVHQ